MSHQVIITFDMDENKIAEYAEKEAGRQIANQVIDETFGNEYNRKGLLKAYAQHAIRELLEPEKDRIIADAIKEVVGTLNRTKVVRDRLAEAMEDDLK